ncbi:hypothetical protein SAMN05216404_101251 [Nitrosospira multiformis]|uniref:Uncharacterized protein n=1 Tax=Nitrosospira multiformis TaxID=1231 RepID=A0A1H8BH75_9PROT|nr:hypothetical protein SAMN05216404_101251 [Nitrosospira multiformis]
MKIKVSGQISALPLVVSFYGNPEISASERYVTRFARMLKNL